MEGRREEKEKAMIKVKGTARACDIALVDFSMSFRAHTRALISQSKEVANKRIKKYF